MKTSFLTLFAFGGFLATTIANPIAAGSVVEKRQDLDAIETSLETLFTQVKEQTAKISKRSIPI